MTDRSSQVRGALLKALVALVAIAGAIALGTMALVRVLDLDESSSAGPSGGGTSEPLPTTALPVPGEEEQEDELDPSESPSESPDGDLQLDASPPRVGPGQRINLTGSYEGNDNVTLQVQRFEGGDWVGFADVTATVTAGTYQTWIQTSRSGEQRLRMFDPETSTASNEATVTVGG